MTYLENLVTGLLLCATAAGAAELTVPVNASRVIDLTHVLYDGMAYWPGGVPFHAERLVDYDQGYRLHSFSMGENTGTHMDAPAHFIRGGRGIDSIPVSDLVVPVLVIDIKRKAQAYPDYQLSRGDILEWEARNHAIPAGSLVVVNTGWHKKFAQPRQYLNQDSAGVMHFPGYSRGAAGLLVERGVAGIGIDTLSIDPGNSTDFAAHHVMLGAGKYQLENLANLDALPETGATAVIGVLPVRDGTQAQARVLAFY